MELTKSRTQIVRGQSAEKKALINSINKMKLTRSNKVKQKKNLLKKQTNVQMKQPTCMTPYANCSYDSRES